jgi:hypothetical protein
MGISADWDSLQNVIKVKHQCNSYILIDAAIESVLWINESKRKPKCI